MAQPIDRSGRPVLVVQKARQVLDSFSAEQPELSLQQLQQRTRLPASTCARLLQTLVHEGILERRGDLYHLGLTLLRWADAASAVLEPVRLAPPVLTALRDETGESAYLYVRDGRHRTCVAVVEAQHAVVQIMRVGQVLPLHAGSAGKVMLAFDPAALGEISGEALAPLTPHTVVDVDALTRATEQTRRVGYAASFEERAVGASSVSAPVFGRFGTLVAALGIASTTTRLTAEQVPKRAAAVVAAADELSRRLGARRAEQAGGSA